MAKYSRMEKFGITVVLILVVVITIGIVLVLTNKGNEESIIIEEVEKANQQISEDTQETLPTGNDEKVEFPGSKPAEKIETEEHNNGKDNSGHGSHVASTAAGNPVGVFLFGIPEEIRDTFFRPLSRGDSRFHEGTGLGLYISKTIIESYNGEIRFENRIADDLSKGTVVVITLLEG